MGRQNSEHCFGPLQALSYHPTSLPVATGKRQCSNDRRSTRFLKHTTAPCLSQIVLKLSYIGQPFVSNFAHKVAHLLFDLSVRDIRWQSAAEWLPIMQWSQWRTYRKPPSLFRMVLSLTPYDLPDPKMGVQNAPQDQLRVACCHLGNMTEDIDKLCAVHYEPSDVTFSPRDATQSAV